MQGIQEDHACMTRDEQIHYYAYITENHPKNGLECNIILTKFQNSPNEHASRPPCISFPVKVKVPKFFWYSLLPKSAP